MKRFKNLVLSFHSKFDVVILRTIEKRCRYLEIACNSITLTCFELFVEQHEALVKKLSPRILHIPIALGCVVLSSCA